jgi:hypothetical protein
LGRVAIVVRWTTVARVRLVRWVARVKPWIILKVSMVRVVAVPLIVIVV